ncbi:glycoside hydrolase superfamily [Aspergillus keveii]|uniref:Glycoside hydrolase superfamily n=1 Tax=Aspergillus keveii TaxID=714993 RepID=A0ABR4FYC0_9EURO
MAGSTDPRTKTSFDDGWKFHLGADIQTPRRLVGKAGTANGWSDLTEQELEHYTGEKTAIEKMGAAFQAIQVRPRDADPSWTDVNLPHDWRIEQTPDPNHEFPADYPKGWHAWWPTGVAYYRKLFTTSAPHPGQHVQLTFDGIAGESSVWLNGFWIGQQTTSYTPLTLDITELLRSDVPNVLLVRSDSSEAEGWWLEGGGIYRHVWMETFGDVHIPQNGVLIATPDISQNHAVVRVEVEVGNIGLDAAAVAAELTFTDPTGDTLSIAQDTTISAFSVPGMSQRTVRKEVSIANPELWNIGKGALYTVTIRLVGQETKELLDTTSIHFGIRTIEWAEDGIIINKVKTKIQGVNLHQDFGYYGSALPDRIIEAKLDMCAEMGVNAIRVAHHSPTPELVRHADRIGMLILPEQRNMSTSAASIEQLRTMIRLFRSSPSVFMWSLENEELSMQGTPVGSAILARLIKECRALDPTRPVTVGGVMNLADTKTGYYQQLDVIGMHYRCLFGTLDESIALHPGQRHVLDEEGLYACTRGVYQYDKAGAYSGSFSYIHEALMDRDEPQANGAIGDIDPTKFSPIIAPNVTLAFSHPKVTGAFLWTGIDYYGEPAPARWPSVVGAYGQRDLAGLPKDYYWLVRSVFKPSEPVVHAFPHWTWSGKEGEHIPFAVFTNCEEVEVEINGTILGDRWPVVSHKAQTREGVVYQPGRICVRGFRSGAVVAEHIQETAGSPTALRLLPDRTVLSASGRDVAIIRVLVVDSEGRFVPDATNEVSFSVKGSGRAAGLCNGDTAFSKYLRATENIGLFHGQAVAFIEAGREEGEVEILASGKGLQGGSTTIRVTSEAPEKGRPIPALDERQVSVYGTHGSLV